MQKQINNNNNIIPVMANKAQVANTGKYNFFAFKYWQMWI